MIVAAPGSTSVAIHGPIGEKVSEDLARHQFRSFIVTDADPRAARITGRINGKEVQRCSSTDLIFDVPALIEWISAWVTLEPGDLIYTGTAGAPAELHAGDTVDVEIDGIGTLTNTVVQG